MNAARESSRWPTTHCARFRTAEPESGRCPASDLSNVLPSDDKNALPPTLGFAQIAAMAAGHAEARALQTALKLGVFEALARSDASADALAHALGCDARATGLLANAMVAMGLLAKSDGRFRLGEPARRYLLRSSPEYLGGMILFDEALWDVWGRLDKSVRSGRPARTPDMFQSRPEETFRFISAMDSLVRARGDACYLADNLDLGGVSRIMDVGGGPGTYVAAMLRRWPGMRGVICDLPATLAVARQILAEREPDVTDRIELVALDYRRDELPGPCDALFMSNIIHSEPPETNRMLMGKCFRALAACGRVIIKDHIMNAEMTEPRAGAIFSLYLLLTTHGRDYSLDEVRRWLEDAGFTAIRELAMKGGPFTSSLVVGEKP